MILPFRDHLAMSGDMFDGGGGATGIQWVEIMDTAEHPSCHAQDSSPTTKIDPTPNASSAEVEKHYSRVWWKQSQA